MKKQKIVHVVQSLQTGGAEKLLVNLAVNCKEEFDITVISQYAKGNLPFEKELEDNGIRTIYLDKKVGFDFGHMVELYRTLNRIQPDIVHTHLHAAVYVIPWYLKSPKTLKLHTVHSVASMELGKVHRSIQRAAYQFLGVIPVAISPSVKESIVAQYKIPEEKVPIILNGVDASKCALVQPSDRSCCDFTFINVASFNVWKNQIFLLESFYRLTLKCPDVRLVL